MGTWGYELFSDDVALDVRDEYLRLLRERPDIEDSDASREILAGVDGAFPDEAAVVWLALASCQSQFGRLDPAVARRAVQIIDDDEGMGGWQEEGPAAVQERRAELLKVRAELTGPQPPRRYIPLPPPTDLRAGDVLSYRATGYRGLEDRYLLLRVARVRQGEPVCVLLDFAGQDIPSLDDVAALADYLWVDRWSPEGRVVSFTMQVREGIDYAQAGYAPIGNIGIRPGDEDIDATRTGDDWDLALTGSAVVSRLLKRWLSARDHPREADPPD